MAVPQSPPPLSSQRRALAAVVVVLAAVAALLAPAGTPATATTLHGAPRAATASTTSVPSYWLVASDGGVFSFGGLGFYGSMGGKPLAKPMVGMAGSRDGKGYWTVASDGGIFSFGDAFFQGSMGGKPLVKPVVGMASDAATGGYWEVASDGGIFSFNAPFFGSMGGKPLAAPVVGMVATSDGAGYWLFASDGGIFSYGDATFYGSMGGKPLAKPIVGAASPDLHGYWLVASDGGIFSFGDAQFAGSLGGQALARPVDGLAASGTSGYWTTDTNGAVTAFGTAGYYGSAPQQLAAPVVAMAEGPGTGQATGNGIYPSGSYGYDLSVFNDNPPGCTTTLPSGHTVGVVQATGWGGSAPNACLAHEANWAGAGLNLYIFLVYGTSATNEPGCAVNGVYDQACNFGYQAALSAFSYVQSKGVNPFVTWWLDVEGPPPSSEWSSNLPENAQVVMGAVNGIRAQGVNNVGVYASPGVWNQIVGNYQPSIPYWVAWWTGSGPYDCQNIASYASTHNELLPKGPVWLAQYSANATTISTGQVDGDYAC